MAVQVEYGLLRGSHSRSECYAMTRLSRKRHMLDAVLLSFSDRVSDQPQNLLQLSRRKWKRLLKWLDVNGVALYLFDRLDELGLCDRLPHDIVERLRQNTMDNAQRTRSLIDESVALQREFQDAGLAYSVHKGISLSPGSVPRPELRHQFDLDFLIAEQRIEEARRILERRGYRLYAISGRSWEFKIHETSNIPIRDLYKDQPGFAVELHLEHDANPQGSRLRRVIYRDMYGMNMPVLPPVDLFLAQVLHAFKDVCSSFLRAAHLLEVYRHVGSRREDDAFWRELRNAVAGDSQAAMGIGVVIYLITSVMGEFAPVALTSWTVETLPASVRLWVDLYGRHAVCTRPPGTKLYLLLQVELERAGVRDGHRIKPSLLPLRLPPAILRASPNETLSTCIARYRLQAHIIRSRLRFHLVEGLRYLWESHRWRKRLGQLPA